MSLVEDGFDSSQNEEREKMKKYWQVYKPSLESMMLNNDAIYLAENDQNELLSYTPNYKGQRVLELGAGIGRFTSRFAFSADHVTAVDFIDSYIEENKKANSHFGNVTFHCADATKLDFEENSFDLVFTNWLFMYLTNSEVETVFEKILKWLNPNGHFLIRESCYHPSGNVKRPSNPTKYRTPLDYFEIFLNCKHEESHYKIKFAKNVLIYVRYYGNPNQLCILVEKVNSKRKCLESHRLDPKLSLFHHHLLGPIFKETGIHSIKSIGSRLRLAIGQRILQLGCGIGEESTELVKNFNCFVHALDTAMANIHTAIERQGKLSLEVRKKIQFENCSDMPLDWNLTSGSYEVVICSDILHRVSDHDVLFTKLKGSLKPGGRLFIADYVASDENKGEGNCKKQNTLTEAELRAMLQNEGLRIEEPVHRGSIFALETLEKRLGSAAQLRELGDQNIAPILTDINDKILELKDGSLKWLSLIAYKLE